VLERLDARTRPGNGRDCDKMKTEPPLEVEDSHKVILTVSGFPWGLIKEIDAMAKAETRSRSGQVVVLLTEIVAAKRQQKIATK
jgi:hypothetical protein